VRVGGIVPEDALEHQIGSWRQAHRRPRVPRPGLLDSIHCQDADEVDGALVIGRPFEAGWERIPHGKSGLLSGRGQATPSM
jgi:hypothetical protein